MLTIIIWTLRSLSLAALFFFLTGTIFFERFGFARSEVLFVSLVAAITGGAWLTLRRRWLRPLLPAVLLVWLVPQNTSGARLFVVATALFCYFMTTSYESVVTDYNAPRQLLKNGTYAVLALVVYTTITAGYAAFEQFGTRYIVLFYAAVISQLRLVRSADSGASAALRINGLFLTVVAALSAALLGGRTGEVVAGCLKAIFAGITRLLFAILYVPLQLLAKFLLWALSTIYAIPADRASEISNKMVLDNMVAGLREVSRHTPWDSSMKEGLGIAALLLLIGAVIVLARRKQQRHGVRQAVFEQREFIMPVTGGLFRKIAGIFKTTTPREIIRANYARFIIRSMDEGALIAAQHTTAEAEKKAITVIQSGREEASRLRKIYLRARFGFEEADKETARATKRLLAKIVFASKNKTVAKK